MSLSRVLRKHRDGQPTYLWPVAVLIDLRRWVLVGQFFYLHMNYKIEPEGLGSQTAEDADIARAQCGEASAFSGIMAKHYAGVLAVAMRHAPFPHLADDVASEAFAFAWANLHKFQVGTDIGAWIRSIAWNMARSLRERESCRARALERYSTHTYGSHPRAISLAAPLVDALARLSPELREAMLLCHFDGYTSDEAAMLLRRTPEWVRTTLHRTRKQLRSVVETTSSNQQPN